MDSPEQRRRGVLASILACVVWGSLTVYWKALKDFDPFELIGWRMLCSAFVMVVIMTVYRRWHHLRALQTSANLRIRVVGAAILLTINWSTYVWAVVNEHVIEAALGYFISPLLITMVGVLVLREHLSAALRFAVGMAAAAVVVLTVSYGEVPWVALLIAGSWTSYSYLKRQVPLAAVDSMTAESLVMVLPALGVVLASAGDTASIPSSAAWWQWALVLFSGVATIIPLTLFAYAAPRVPFTVLGPMQYTIPTINFLLGWLVYHEPMTTTRLIGFAMVWAGLLAVTVSTLRQRSSVPTDSADTLRGDNITVRRP